MIYLFIAFGLVFSADTTSCTEGDQWDQLTCEPKSCVNGQVVVSQVTCPTDPCPAGSQYTAVADQCCDVCQPVATNAPAPPPGPPVNMRKFCEDIFDPNMCKNRNGCEWNVMGRECKQLNCEKIYGDWRNCAKSAGCMWSPEDRKCNDQVGDAFAGLQFGPGSIVAGFTPNQFSNPSQFNMPDYQNPINGDSTPGYYGGFEPQMPMTGPGANGFVDWSEFEMEDMFKNPMMYNQMLNFYQNYMSQKFTICGDLAQDPCQVEQACSWTGTTCTQNDFAVSASYNGNAFGGTMGYPFLSEAAPQQEEQTSESTSEPPVVFYVGLGFAGVILGFLSAVGLQTLCCNKHGANSMRLDEYLRENV